ncbi:hypothetical protein HN011_002568 [Eciton burchellii]|nr:hypothetical protein HN011_002568 [Eciton burchellii]
MVGILRYHDGVSVTCHLRRVRDIGNYPKDNYDMLKLLLLAHLALATDQVFDIAYSWKQLEFKFPNDSIRNELIASGEYIPENNMPTATLNSFSMESSTRSPILMPYPDLDTNDIHGGLVSIFRVRCLRMWGLDTGINDILESSEVVRPMTLVIIDLKTNKIIRKYEDVTSESMIVDLVVDVAPDRCDQCIRIRERF